MNELSLFSEKTVTTKELAEILKVDVKTIQRTAEKLFDINVVKFISTGGRPSMCFNETQATAIKIELQNHSKVAQNGFSTMIISNDLEAWELQKRLDAYKDKRIAELQKENELQKQQIAEQKPKVDSYNRISNSTGLKTIQEVADILGYGSKTYFSLLRGEKILFLTNGINLPKREYIDSGYFEVKEVPYERNGQSCLYSKVYVTAKGLLWHEKKTPKRA